MMSGHDANLIFFNKKKNKDRTSRRFANPPTPLPYPPHPLSKWTPYVYLPFARKVDPYNLIEVFTYYLSKSRE